MDDLIQAILDVLDNAVDVRSQYHTDDCDDRMAVDTKLLKNLQAEYNIYFVEPEDKQVDLI